MTILQAAKLARQWMAHWMENEECDCEIDHICGKRDRERELKQIDSAIAEEEAKVQSSARS